jgi:DNA-directed RNA polymerase specialized sigma24 family protein
MNGTPVRQQNESTLVSAEEILRVYGRIAQTCRYAGLPRADSEDIAQEIWTWLLRAGELAEALRADWMSAVTRNFILRYWRRTRRHAFREGISLEATAEPEAFQSDPERHQAELLDRMNARLPGTERNLLIFIRRGYSFIEAADALRVPRGSRAYFKRRLIDAGRRELRRNQFAVLRSPWPKYPPERSDLGRQAAAHRGPAGRTAPSLSPFGNATLPCTVASDVTCGLSGHSIQKIFR